MAAEQAVRPFSETDSALLYAICRDLAPRWPRGTPKTIATAVANRGTADEIKKVERLMVRPASGRTARNMLNYAPKIASQIACLLREPTFAAGERDLAILTFIERTDWEQTTARDQLKQIWRAHSGGLKKSQSPFGEESTSAPAQPRAGAEAAFQAFARMCAPQSPVHLAPKGLLRPETSADGKIGQGARYILIRLHTRDASMFIVHGVRIAPHQFGQAWTGSNLLYFSETYNFKEPRQTEVSHRSKGVCFLDNRYLTAFARPANGDFFTHFVGHIHNSGASAFEAFPAIITSKNGYEARFSAAGLCLRCEDKSREEELTGMMTATDLAARLNDAELGLLEKWRGDFWARELMDDRPRRPRDEA